MENLTDIIVGGASPYGEAINQPVIDLSKDAFVPEYIDPVSATRRMRNQAPQARH